MARYGTTTIAPIGPGGAGRALLYRLDVDFPVPVTVGNAYHEIDQLDGLDDWESIAGSATGKFSLEGDREDSARWFGFSFDARRRAGGIDTAAHGGGYATWGNAAQYIYLDHDTEEHGAVLAVGQNSLDGYQVIVLAVVGDLLVCRNLIVTPRGDGPATLAAGMMVRAVVA